MNFSSYRHFATALAILLIVLYSSTVSGQDSTRTRRLSYGLIAQPGLTYRYLSAGRDEGWLKSYRDSHEKARASLSFGLSVTYLLTQQLSVRSGLSLLDMGYQTRKEELVWWDGEPASSAQSHIHNRYIELPLMLEYRFYRRGPVALLISGGVSPAVFIGRTTLTSGGGDNHTDHQAVGYNRFNFVAGVRGGIEYSLSRKIALSGQVYFDQFINAANSNLPSKEFFHSTGLCVNATYRPQKKIN